MSQALSWDDHSWMTPMIEAAIAFGRPPLQFILVDPAHVEFSQWDLKIANAHYLLKHYEVNGYPVWLDQSPRVMFETKERKSRSQEQLDIWQQKERKRLEKKGSHPKYGVAPYVVPRTVDGGPMPTKRDWIEAQRTGVWSNEMKLSTGEVVKTVADPEKMNEFRAKIRAQRSRRRAAAPVD